MFKMNGLDDLIKSFEKMEKNAKELDGNHNIPLGDLMNEKFMSKNTKFATIDDFFENSPFTVETDEDFDSIDKDELDEYVQENTKFSSWEDMLEYATEFYSESKLLEGTGF